MKRINRARKIARLGTATLSVTLATTTIAPAAAFGASPGEYFPPATTPAQALSETALYDAGNEAVPSGHSSQMSQGWDLSIDPSLIEELIEAFRPSGDENWVSKQSGADSLGNEVSSPTTGTFSSVYGSRAGKTHKGIDIANSVGTPIYSVMDGEVISSGPAQGFGNWIRVRHDDGAISVYGHMPSDMLYVSVGDRVSAGQEIAGMGNEGRSTGPHLHFEIYPDSLSAVDPVPWFDERGISI